MLMYLHLPKMIIMILVVIVIMIWTNLHPSPEKVVVEKEALMGSTEKETALQCVRESDKGLPQAKVQ